MLLGELRRQIVFYGKQMLDCGLTMHTGGNLSARDREMGYIVIKPSGVPYDLLTPEDIPVIDLQGNLIEGSRKPSSEWPMHTLIYQTFPRVRRGALPQPICHCGRRGRCGDPPHQP